MSRRSVTMYHLTSRLRPATRQWRTLFAAGNKKRGRLARRMERIAGLWAQQLQTQCLFAVKLAVHMSVPSISKSSATLRSATLLKFVNKCTG